MSIYQLAAWSVIVSLSLMVVGGLVLWAYGARRRAGDGVPLKLIGPEAEAAQLFHIKLARWFFFYGMAVILIGAGMLLWAVTILA